MQPRTGRRQEDHDAGVELAVGHHRDVRIVGRGERQPTERAHGERSGEGERGCVSVALPCQLAQGKKRHGGQGGGRQHGHAQGHEVETKRSERGDDRPAEPASHEQWHSGEAGQPGNLRVAREDLESEQQTKDSHPTHGAVGL